MEPEVAVPFREKDRSVWEFGALSAHGFGEELRGVALGTKQEHCVVHYRIAVLGAHSLLENVVEARAPADGERCAVEPDVKFERQTRFTAHSAG